MFSLNTSYKRLFRPRAYFQGRFYLKLCKYHKFDFHIFCLSLSSSYLASWWISLGGCLCSYKHSYNECPFELNAPRDILHVVILVFTTLQLHFGDHSVNVVTWSQLLRDNIKRHLLYIQIRSQWILRDHGNLFVKSS